MERSNIKFTYGDYCLMPEDSRYELIEGDLLMVPSPSAKHQQACANLEHILQTYVRQTRLGIVLDAPLDVKLSEYNVVQPDIFFVSRERAGIIEERYVRAAPDLVVEILSPSTSTRDLDIKRRLYSKYGVKEYWIVDPDARSVEVCRQGQTGLETVKVFSSGERFQSTVISGLEIEVDEIFRNPLEND